MNEKSTRFLERKTTERDRTITLVGRERMGKQIDKYICIGQITKIDKVERYV